MNPKLEDFIQRHSLSPKAREELSHLWFSTLSDMAAEESNPQDAKPHKKGAVALLQTLDVPPASAERTERDEEIAPTADDLPPPVSDSHISFPKAPSPNGDKEKRRAIPMHTQALPSQGKEHGSGLQQSFLSDFAIDLDESILPWLPKERYEVLGELGRGGMGTVWRVFDHRLKRELALKAIHPEWMETASALSRFVEEAQATSQLQHPGIVPVYDFEQLPSGHCFFTMKIMEGRTFGELIQEHHLVSPHENQRKKSVTRQGLRQLVDAFRRVCEAVAYAHNRGVLHRDLKPQNIMLGQHGEVMVMDWGLVKVADASSVQHQGVRTERAQARLHETLLGSIQGTPAYMPPEQAAGHHDSLGPYSDIYSLGAILYEILSGHPPVIGRSPQAVLTSVMEGRIPPPARPEGSWNLGTRWDKEWSQPTTHLSHAPGELLKICDRAMSLSPNQRHQSADELAQEVAGWLEGRLQHERALSIVAAAKALLPEAKRLREQATLLSEEGAAALEGVGRWEPEEKKQPGWEKLDHAKELERQARLKDLEYERLLHAAFTYDPDLEEAHTELASSYFQTYLHAEEVKDEDLMLTAEHRLKAELAALPSEHPTRISIETVYEGTGTLSLVTEPPGAEVHLFEYQQKSRRLQPQFLRNLGQTPLLEIPLPMGSYLLEVRKDGYHTTSYPVFITRQEHWNGVHPDGATRPLWLPPDGSLGEDDCYIPAGWFWSGGDPLAPRSFARQKLWLDSFVMRKYHITNLEFLAFLDDLVEQGREEEALLCVPCERPGTMGERGPMIYGRTPSGHFELRPDADGDLWYPDEPVTMVDWFSVSMYARWMAERTGQPWRICTEWEWEKAARGVDGRSYPWGNFFDHSWCCVAGSYPNAWITAKIHEFPTDCSPYGVRSMGGNVREWCGELYDETQDDAPPQLPFTPPMPPSDLPVKQHMKVRGASWGYTNSALSRGATRTYDIAGGRDGGLGFRLCRPMKEEVPT